MKLRWYMLAGLVAFGLMVLVGYSYGAEGTFCYQKSSGVVKYESDGVCEKNYIPVPIPQGPKGDQGPQGLQGAQGIAGLDGQPASTEVPENDYVVYTSVNSGWAIVPEEIIQDGVRMALIHKPDGRPYTLYFYQWGWWRTYYYKALCAIDPAGSWAITSTFPAAMGGALLYPGLEMCP